MTLESAVLAAGAGSFVLSLVATPVVRAVARAKGFVDEPGPRKIHAHPVALGGGVAIFAAIWLPLAVAFSLVSLAPDFLRARLPAGMALHVAGAQSVARLAWAWLAGGAVIFALGLVDDARGLGPRVKLLVQVAVGVALAASGIRLSTLDAWPGAALLQGALTVGWFVIVTNAFNLLDNMDGLAAGVAATTAAAFGLIALFTGQLFIALALFTLLGAALGFLAFNRPPASIFMGDAGSLTLGYHLAVLTILFTFYDQAHPLTVYFVPLLVLAVPFYDTFSVIWIRWRAGKPLMVGDNNHFSHRLVALGLSRGAAVATIVLLTAVTGLSAVILYRLDSAWSALPFIQTLAVLVLVAVLEVAGRKK